PGSNIGRNCDRQEAAATASGEPGDWIRLKSILEKINPEIRPKRVGEIRVIEKVEGIDPELHGYMLRDGCVLDQAEIEVLIIGPDEGVTPQIPEMFRARYAVSGPVI